MKFLVDVASNKIFEVGKITKGIFKDVDANTQLYKVENEKGTFYAVAAGFTVKEVDEVPADYAHLYYTDERGFYEVDEDVSEEEKRFLAIESKIEYMSMMLDIEIPAMEV